MNRSNWYPAFKASLTICLLAALGSTHAGERLLYRSVLPNGSVVYADAPVQGAETVQRLSVEPHPDDPRAAARALAAGEQRQQDALASFERRAQRSRELQAQVAQAEVDAALARQLRADGSNVREGDRQGRRWTGQYAQRQADLALQEERAQSRLASLREQLAALQP